MAPIDPARTQRQWLRVNFRTVGRFVRNDWVTAFAVLILVGSFVAALFAPLFAPVSPTTAKPVDRLQPLFSEGYLLGTDQLGRDMLSRLLFGARLAWTVGVASSGLAVIVGGILGAVAGFYRGWLDAFISRFVDGLMAFPPVLLALVIAAVLGPSTRTGILALAVVFAPLASRVMRAEVIAQRDLEYVLASRNLGKPEWLVLLQDVLPNTVSAMSVTAVIISSRAVVIEASLSFLGVGTQPPAANWGVMIGESREFLTSHARLWVLPGVALAVTVLASNIVADFVRQRQNRA